MDRSELRTLIRKFLRLLQVPSDSQENAESELRLLLDQLALARHFVVHDFDAQEYPDPPTSDYAQLRSAASHRFPQYGAYNVPEYITTDLGTSPCGLADAIDDIADIARDLQEVEWRWSHTSDEDALFHFNLTFDQHWGEHLRGLQQYLHARPRGG